MRIKDLKDRQKNVNINLKVIYDQMKEKEYKGRIWKTLVVVDADLEEGGTTALLDVCEDDIEKFKFKNKLKVINGYAKKTKNKRGEQFVITYGFLNDKFIGKYEKIEDGDSIKEK